MSSPVLESLRRSLASRRGRPHRFRAAGSAGSLAVALVVLSGGPTVGQTDPQTSARSQRRQSELRQTQADAYTRYELLAPDSQSFRIVYDVTATTPGARLYFNPIRPGSEPTVHSVVDLATGEALAWKLVGGAQAQADGLAGARADGQYIRIALGRPVPALADAAASTSPGSGEARLRIDKTYKDPASYGRQGREIVFERSLGIKRNSVVLPAGHELVGCNYPVQVATEADGRLRLSFMNRGPVAVPLRVVGRRLPATSAAAPVSGEIRTTPPASRSVPTSARTDYELSERAFQDREIVYFLQSPETHAFRLYHDYTETRPGTDRYLNVVRSGSKASDPRAWNLDTGERLRVETLRGSEIAKKGIDIGRAPSEDTEVVAIWFEAVKSGKSARLRIEETYTDAGRYGLVGDELLWDRGFGRPRNAVVLPAGWRLTMSAVPGTITETEDGRIRLDFENDRPGNLEVLIRGLLR